MGHYGLVAKGYVFGALFAPLGNHNKWRTDFKLVAQGLSWEFETVGANH